VAVPNHCNEKGYGAAMFKQPSNLVMLCERVGKKMGDYRED